MRIWCVTIILGLFIAFSIRYELHKTPLMERLLTSVSEIVKPILMRRLTYENVETGPRRAPKDYKSIYVLGGSQRSLEYRYKTAAALFLKGEGTRIIILIREGITEYDLETDRNLTNDEWSIRTLGRNGVGKAFTEPFYIKPGYFGTMREAREVSRRVLRDDERNLLLVTSRYHTRRTWLSFQRYLAGSEILVTIIGSEEMTSVPGLALEYMKLLSYRYVLLPIDRGSLGIRTLIMKK